MITKELLDKATADAGLPPMEWAPDTTGALGLQRQGWWWTPPLSHDTREVQEMGRKICAASPELEYVAAALPRGVGVALAVGPRS